MMPRGAPTLPTPTRLTFRYNAVRDQEGSNNAKFVLTSSNGGYFPELTSSVFNQVYDNSKWSLAVRVKPDSYPQASYASGSLEGVAPGHKWVVELYGAQYVSDVFLNEFSASTGIAGYPDSPSIASTDAGFVTGSKRVYVGAHTTNFTGSVITKSDVKMAACRYWLDYLENDTIKAHAKDVSNYGALAPYKNAYLFQTGSLSAQGVLPRVFNVPQIETLALNWDFEQVTGSNASGQFIVSDFSSGSLALGTSSYGSLGPILKVQHPGLGYNFPASATKVVDVDYLVSARQTLPENIYAQDMISILDEADDLQFTRESRPINFFFAFEKSMYSTISQEMLNIFGTINDFNNLIGEPVNKYRMNYKRMEKLRTLFFERVSNTPDLEKYVEFYKWFDSSLGKILEQMIPASADFGEGVRVTVENTILARDKYQHKFPTLEMKVQEPEGAIHSGQNASPGWKFTHRPLDGLQSTNAHWWKEMALRANADALATPNTGVNFGRSMILKARQSIRNRKKTTPYRINFENLEEARRVIRGGVNIPRGSRRDILYTATWPAGPLKAGTNLPSNVMLLFAEDVNKGKDISDVLNPSKKKRLSFELDTAINKSVPYTVMDGATAAPFSLYSSSYPYHMSGYSALVSSSFTDDVELTNLHNDVYGPHYETPVQGPFTEKFVGGRQYRHIELNQSSAAGPLNGLDNSDTRAEGFKILLGKLIDGTTERSGALGIVGPQYPEPDSPAVSPPYLYNRPKANMLREETAKRPVNIKNIKMTADESLSQNISGALIHNRIGNYEHNYQIVQTAGRSINDPFFRDQSFDFALYPEIAFGRGYGLPNVVPRVTNMHSVWVGGCAGGDSSAALFASSVTPTDAYQDSWDATAAAASLSEWNTALAGKQITVSAWIYKQGDGGGNEGRILSIGDGGADQFDIYTTSTEVIRVQGECGASDLDNRTAAAAISLNTWHHVVVAWDGNASTPEAATVYVDGAAVALDGSYNTARSGWIAGSFTETGVVVGSNSDQNRAFCGYINDVAIWDRALSAAEVKTVYNDGYVTDLRAVQRSGTIAWWRMGDGTGDTNSTIGRSKLIDQIGTNTLWGISTDPGYTTIGRNQVSSPNFFVSSTKNFTLPNRTGPNSNHSIFVNRFGAPGGYEVASLGYMDPAHEEKSVYNALPFRNLPVRSSGSGYSGSMRVLDQLNYSRGLRTLEALHCGQFGIDGQYGVLPLLTYPTTPSWQKINRNARQRFEFKTPYGGNIGSNRVFTDAELLLTGTVYDNANVYRPIPQSTKQYSWVNASMISGAVFFGYDGPEQPPSSAAGYSTPNGYPATKMENLLITASDVASYMGTSGEASSQRYYGKDKKENPTDPVFGNFAGININIIDPITSSTQTRGAGLSYTNSSTTPYAYKSGFITRLSNTNYFNGGAKLLNTILLHRNGPYGWPTFRQIQAGPHRNPIVTALRNKNILSLRTRADTNRPQVFPANGNSIIQYHEAPVQSLHRPLEHTIVSLNNTEDPASDSLYQVLTYKSSYGNKLDYFTNIQLNNKLDLQYHTRRSDLYINRLNAILLKDQADQSNSPFETLNALYVNYSQRVYPAGVNVYRPQNRKREAYSIKDVWNFSRNTRSELPSASIGRILPAIRDLIPSASVWPMDAHNNWADSYASNAAPVAGYGSQSAGVLLNGFSGFSDFGDLSITASATYASRAPYGYFTNGAGTFTNFAGDQLWTANSRSFGKTIPSATNKEPYIDYDKYCENLRLVGKDYSIVPEFRISDHMDYYINSASTDWLADNDGFLSLTGSVLSSSTQDNFFKTYTNSDFLKLFDAIDGDYGDNMLVNNDIIKKDKLSLRCNALLKFLPYKGFYPAERTVELYNLFSSSYGAEWGPQSLNRKASESDTITATPYNFPPAARAIVEPLFSPGILFNTIKSGIAVSSFIVKNDYYVTSGYDITGSYPPSALGTSIRKTAADHTQIKNSFNYFGSTGNQPWYGSGSLLNLPMSSAAWTPTDSNYYYMQKLPFEALLQPEDYLSINALVSSSDGVGGGYSGAGVAALTNNERNPTLLTRQSAQGYIYDSGIGSASLASSYSATTVHGTKAHYLNRVRWNGDGKRNYRLAVDNFVCETLDFFQTPLTSYASKREDQFLSVKAGQKYSMKIRLDQPLKDGAAHAALGPEPPNFVEPGKFLMYGGRQSFGRPLSSSWAKGVAAGSPERFGVASFVHVTPSHYHGYSEVNITFTPQYDGVPVLSDIWENSVFEYTRTGERISFGSANSMAVDTPSDPTTLHPQINGPSNPMRQKAQQISASINLKDKISEVIPGTVTAKDRWVIQSKFETPILNFSHQIGAGVAGETTAPASKTATSPALGAAQARIIGMWHQNGVIPTGSAGLFAHLIPPPRGGLKSGRRPSHSLADVVGFSPESQRIGQLKDAKVISEAVVAIPYTLGSDGRKKFYKLKRRQVNGAIRISRGLQTATEVPPTVQHVVNSVQKYVFPPKFDFVTMPTVDPLVMYVFEFSKTLTQQDLADIWQNLPPDNTGETFQASTVTIQHSLMADDFYDEGNRKINSDMRWMVFKVKRKAASNYNKYKKKHLTNDLSTIPNSIDSKFTYNWPYDYFSLVELVKMDAGIQYASVPGEPEEPEPPPEDLGEEN